MNFYYGTYDSDRVVRKFFVLPLEPTAKLALLDCIHVMLTDSFNSLQFPASVKEQSPQQEQQGGDNSGRQQQPPVHKTHHHEDRYHLQEELEGIALGHKADLSD